jgi:hypothetical protein
MNAIAKTAAETPMADGGPSRSAVVISRGTAAAVPSSDSKARTYDATDQVFLKHWLPEKMPPTYRTGLVFVDDSQGFGSLASMVSEFSTWGQTFAPSPVGFQFGYKSDQAWRKSLSDRPRTIGNAILWDVPNTRDLVWVDFTAEMVWPQ